MLANNHLPMKNGNWIVRVKATVLKDIFVVNATEEAARTEPFEHAESEEEVEQQDYEVIDVQPND